MSISVKKSLLALCFVPLLACSQTPSNNGTGPASKQITQDITKNLESAYKDQGLSVVSINNTPISGVYEVVMPGNQIVYTNDNGNYMIAGNLIDVKTKKSITEDRIAEMSTVDFSQLPFENAIKDVRGNGKRVVAVFSDPDCPFCKKLEHELGQMTDVTIYTFLMPIPSLHPNAEEKAVQIWCQADKASTWTQWMRNDVMPKKVATCTNPVEKNMTLGQKFGFNGTPTLVFPNGRTISGFAPKEVLEKAITENQK